MYTNYFPKLENAFQSCWIKIKNLFNSFSFTKIRCVHNLVHNLTMKYINIHAGEPCGL